MNWKTWVPLCAAILMGIFAAKIGRDFLAKSHKEAAAPPAQMTSVVVAKDEVAAGAMLKETDVSVVQLPPAAVPSGAFANPADVANRVALTRFVKGQPILDTMLLAAGSPKGLNGMVPDGMRAVTFEVNEVSGVAGLLVPGARVDIVMTLIPTSGGSEAEARTVAQNLRLVAVGRKVISNSGDEDQTVARSVTLLATPHQAELIELASHVGHPRLVLRGWHDDEMIPSKGVTVAELMDMNASPKSVAQVGTPPVPVAPVAPVSVPATKPVTEHTVQIIRNTIMTTTTFQVPAPTPLPPPLSTAPAQTGTAETDQSPAIRGGN